jgi:hypothetical protein
MAKPQQPELARSGRGATDPASAKAAAANTLPAERPGGNAPIPEDNLPGHHPPVEQDKPTGPPPRRRPRKPAKAAEEKAPKDEPLRFDFEFDSRLGKVDRLLGVRPDNTFIEVADGRVTIQFGPWRVETTKDNIVSAETTGPYAWWKVAGPPHVSLRDRGLTMATTTDKGVCLRFRNAVKGIEPTGVLRHPGLTVTPSDPERLVEALTGSG